MSDVADMLGIANQPRQQLSAGEEASKLLADKPKAAAAEKKKKPKGMKREVFDLIAKDGIAPSVQTNSMNPVFKSKRTLVTEGKWVWASIESSARSDHLQSLRHWVRADKFYPDYPYAQFNVKMDAITFTDEQYSTLLEHSDWTKEDTVKLMEVSREYDLRWPVITDRITLSVEKKSEELQARYYFVHNTIQQANASSNALSFGNPITVKTYNFDLEKEALRRKKQDYLYYRTKEEEKEEVKLREELKSINEQLKKLKKTMKTAMRESSTLASSSSSAIPTVKSEISTADTTKTAGTVANESSDATAVSSSGANSSQATKLGQYLTDGKLLLDASISNPIDASDPALVAAAAMRKDAPQPGKPALQSGRLYLSASQPIGKTTFAKMNNYLRELNIPEHPVATKRVCDLIDAIRRDTQALIAVQNQVKKKEKDVQQSKTGIFKNTSGNGRTSAEQAISAGKAIAAKAEKASKPKAPPKARQQKKDAPSATSASTDGVEQSEQNISSTAVGAEVPIKSEPGESMVTTSNTTTPSLLMTSPSTSKSKKPGNETSMAEAPSPAAATASLSVMDVVMGGDGMDETEAGVSGAVAAGANSSATNTRKRNRSKMTV